MTPQSPEFIGFQGYLLSLSVQAWYCSLPQPGVLDPGATRMAMSNWKLWADRGKDDFVVVGGLHSRFIAGGMPRGLFEVRQNCRQAKLAYLIAQDV